MESVDYSRRFWKCFHKRYCLCHLPDGIGGLFQTLPEMLPEALLPVSFA
jgi:hypothetical protein